MEKGIVVRRAKEADLPAVISLCEAFHKTSPFAGIKFDVDSANRWVQFLHGEGGIVQVAVLADEVVGLVMGPLSPYPGNMNEFIAVESALYVQDKARGSGAGRMLSKKFEQVAKQRGARLVFLSALGNNLEVPAKMYAKEGYDLVEAHFMKDVG